jgi:hypothetical protein
MKKICVMLAIAAAAFVSLRVKAEAANARRCPEGTMTCSAWCVKYRPNQWPSYMPCLRTAPRNCVNYWGGVRTCVRDVPPSGANAGLLGAVP